MTDAETFAWNNYIIKKRFIGKGSFSKVYYGYHSETKMEIAMKKIRFTSLQNTIKDKVISEINILKKMNHDNIMKLYEYRFDGDYIVLITEYCNEKDIGEWMKVAHNTDEILAMITQIVTGVAYMHSQLILHRDIKPENILIHNGVVKICDFGFSTIIKEHAQMMQTICGTPLFMSPELLFMKPYTMKSDIWSLGVLFYMMCYRAHPFGIIISLDDYRIKIKRAVIYISIDAIPYIVGMLEQMLSYDAEKRPEIDQIVQIITQKTVAQVDYTNQPINEVVSNEHLSRNQLLERINELEADIFELEEHIDEKRSSCCFGVDSPAVTGRGRTNSGYELSITSDYFTPPELQLGAVSIPKMSSSSRTCSIRSRSSKSSPGSFLSSSIEKLSAFFSFGKK
jgi:serine/threonine protein kinase